MVIKWLRPSNLLTYKPEVFLSTLEGVVGGNRGSHGFTKLPSCGQLMTRIVAKRLLVCPILTKYLLGNGDDEALSN